MEIINKSRRTGKLLAIVLDIKDTIEKGDEASVLGCDNPEKIIDMLKDFGLNTISKPIITREPSKMIVEIIGNEECIKGFSNGKSKTIGYTFYKN